MNENGVMDLIAAVILQAVADYRVGYTHQNRPDAAAFLTSAGLLSASGELDRRFGTPSRQRVLRDRQGRQGANTMIAESEIKARVRAIQQQQEAEIEAQVRAEAEAQARADEDALDKQAAQKRVQRIVKTRADIAKKLDLASLEVARAELREALDRYVSTCAAYDRRYAECWNDVTALVSSGPMPSDLAVTTFAISCDGHTYRKSRLHHMLIELAKASVEAHKPPDKINFYSPPQD